MIDQMLSVIVVVQNEADRAQPMLDQLGSLLAKEVSGYEIIVVDNHSTDDTVPVLEDLARRYPNIQVYCLASRADWDVACMAGMEQAIGDYVILFD